MFQRIIKLGRQNLWESHREYLREKHDLKYLFWECTLNCNFQCSHCGSSAGGKYCKEKISTTEIKKAFQNIAETYDPRRITIAVTGGEPLLRKDLFEVMSYATSLGFCWGMVTNGYLVTKNVVRQAKRSGMKTIDVSIDGVGDVHDRLRNTKGSYKKAINAVKLFAHADFLKPLRITTTIHKGNIHQLQKMYKTFSRLGISDWRLLNVDPIGRALVNKHILLDEKENKKFYTFIKQKRKNRSKIRITSGCAHYLGEELEDEVRNNFFYCSTGINIGSILHNGDIFVCPNVPRKKYLIQGNIQKDKFSEIWNTKYDFFRDKDRTACTACRECEHWKHCLGGSLHSWDFDKKQPKVCLMKTN